jgi:four helix bundle protein
MTRFSERAAILRKSRGLPIALMCRMAGAKRFTDLAPWKRAHELQILCLELLKDPRVQRDFEFRDQLADAASSGPRNIAEGFGRYRPRENAQYVRVAKGSANEVHDLFIEAQTKGFIKPEDFPPLRHGRESRDRDDGRLPEIPR